MDEKEAKNLKNMMELLLCTKFVERIDRMRRQRQVMFKIFHDFFPESREWLREFEEYVKKEPSLPCGSRKRSS